MGRIGRALGRGLVPPRFQGIRFRLGIALAIALLPILVLGAAQTRSSFEAQDTDLRHDLQLAAERTAASAGARLDSTTVLLQVLQAETPLPECEARLGALVERLDGLDGLVRLAADGGPVCVSRGLADGRPSWLTRARETAWFQRLRAGEDPVLAREPAAAGRSPGLIVAIRVERPDGRFDGAMVALIPRSSLEPEIDDPTLPAGAESALTDGKGRLLTATAIGAFTLSGNTPLTDRIARARRETSGLFVADDVNGRRRVYAEAALAGRDVHALLSTPAPPLLSWVRLSPAGGLFIPLLSFVAAFLCVMLVSERIVVRWLAYLERVAAIYARGRFSVRPVQAINAPSEIRVLARTLDELAETITTRDAALMTSLAEKDALMREIHHRVKNNLQIISSLLSMQQRTLTDPASKAAVGDTRQRISALALIYRTLYQSDDLRYADARIFLTELVGQLVAGETGRGHLVTSSVEADSLVVDPDKLAPLALWLVEAVTNAQKHAFAGRGGDLKVRFRVRGETSVLEVQDDGPGVGEVSRAGVGRTLMGAFAKQLRGEAEIIDGPNGGTIARMVFATPEAVVPTDPADHGSADRWRR